MTFSRTGTRSRIEEIFDETKSRYGSSNDGFHALGVGHHVRRQVALVEAHALDEVHLHAEGLAFLDGDDAVLADLVDGGRDHLADLRIGRARSTATWAICSFESTSIEADLM